MRFALFLAALATGSCIAVAQQPPIKMGLWEKSVEITMASGKPMTTTDKSCVTPATWQRMVTNATKPRDNCKIDTQKVSNGYTFSATCNVQGGMSMEMSGNTKVTDAEHIVTESHSTFTMNGQKRETTIHGTSRYLGADCGSVKPSEPEPAGK